jgi:homoserine kinase
MAVQVSVPATSANLGPGFDCLGVALGVHLKLRIAESAEAQILGVGRHHPLDRNLTHRGLVAAYTAAGIEAPAVSIRTIETYPSARGLGASASAIVGGLVAARALGGLNLTDDDLGGLAVEIEGHADNVLPALFGGLVLSFSSGMLRFDPSPDICPLVLVAGQRFKTSQARKVLPESVSRADAVVNVSSTAALVAAFTGFGASAGLTAANNDRLHEPYRLPLMPETMQLATELRAAGFAVALSGAGPSLICLAGIDELDRVVTVAEPLLPDGWAILTPGWDLKGAQVMVS